MTVLARILCFVQEQEPDFREVWFSRKRHLDNLLEVIIIARLVLWSQDQHELQHLPELGFPSGALACFRSTPWQSLKGSCEGIGGKSLAIFNLGNWLKAIFSHREHERVHRVPP